jgi:hypothetical protein
MTGSAAMRRVLVILGLLLSLFVSTATVGHAASGGSGGPVVVQGGCEWYGCGKVVNSTSRGFYITLAWGSPWSDDIVKWVSPWSSYGGNGVDVDGILVANGCVMSGAINGGVFTYNYPFVWTSGWHKITTNETAFVSNYTC